MPDFEDKIPISEFSYTNTLHNTDQAPIIQQDGADWDNFRTSMADIGLHINKDMEYVTDLHTTSKKIIGAINELADGGSSMDITTEIDTPASVQTFSDGGDNIPMKSCEVAIVASQSGSGTPSPSNVRNISGFSSVNAVVSSKNLFGGFMFMTGYAINNSGVITSSSSYDLWFLLIKKNVQYTISFTESVTNTQAVRVGTFDSSNTNVQLEQSTYSGGGNKSITFTFTSDFAVSYLSIRNSCSNIQLEEGATATAYEQPTTHTIPLGQTIYGGEAELVSGSGVKEYGYIEFDGSSDEDWSYASGNKWATITIPDMMSGANQDGITNWLPKSTSYGTFGFALGRNNNNFYAYQIPDISGVTDLASWKTYLSNNPLQVVYPLATPTAFTFTGANIPTLSGTNNIYADSGDVQSLEYFNNKGDDIASMVRLMTRS